ncbi:hypothetical protein MSIMFB_02882 [Mycobacterium simulans]|uniref:Uncharacterized protein n=1 Tax=Mycobacterium simulans TaxID=627089 RepID=A0A7Z7IKT0_9MYCO|nr:hypothetical protein MSIMFB_02882 [Mycobacterium simulans]
MPLESGGDLEISSGCHPPMGKGAATHAGRRISQAPDERVKTEGEGRESVSLWGA